MSAWTLHQLRFIRMEQIFERGHFGHFFYFTIQLAPRTGHLDHDQASNGLPVGELGASPSAFPLFWMAVEPRRLPLPVADNVATGCSTSTSTLTLTFESFRLACLLACTIFRGISHFLFAASSSFCVCTAASVLATHRRQPRTDQLASHDHH